MFRNSKYKGVREAGRARDFELRFTCNKGISQSHKQEGQTFRDVWTWGKGASGLHPPHQTIIRCWLPLGSGCSLEWGSFFWWKSVPEKGLSGEPSASNSQPVGECMLQTQRGIWVSTTIHLCVICIHLISISSAYLAVAPPGFWFISLSGEKTSLNGCNWRSCSLLTILDPPFLSGTGSLCRGVTQTSFLRYVNPGHHDLLLSLPIYCRNGAEYTLWIIQVSSVFFPNSIR